MAGLQNLGLEPFAQEGHRLWQLNAVKIPAGIDDMTVRSRLLRDFNIEISGGLGDGKGKIWRIGVMGYSAQRGNIRLLLSALEDILEDLGHVVERRAATDAAQDIYDEYEAEQEKQAAQVIVESNNGESGKGVGETIAAEEVAQGVAHED